MSIYLQCLCNERSLGCWCILEVSVLKAISVRSENGGQPKTSPWAKGTWKKEINGSYGQKRDNENCERTPEQRMGRGGQMEICIRSLYTDINKTEKQQLLLLLFLLSLELGKIFPHLHRWCGSQSPKMAPSEAYPPGIHTLGWSPSTMILQWIRLG